GSQWLAAAADALNVIPLLAAQRRAGRLKSQEPLKASEITNRHSLETRLNSALKQTVLSPLWLSGYGNVLSGGFSPSEVNLDAAAARYWRDAPAAERQRHELDLLNRALTIQGEYLNRPVPTQVRRAVRESGDLTQRLHTFAADNGRSATLKETASMALTYLAENGRIPQAEAAKLRSKLAGLNVPGEISAFKTALLVKYGSLQALADWDRDVRTVAQLTPQALNQKAAQLHAYGVADQAAYKVSPQAL